jgi:hypothetical protein
LLYAFDSLSNGLIGIFGRSDDFPEGRVRVGSLAQDNRPEPRSQRILIFKGGIGDAQALRRVPAKLLIV